MTAVRTDRCIASPPTKFMARVSLALPGYRASDTRCDHPGGQHQDPDAGSKPLRENAVVQSQVAMAEAKWQSSRAFLMQTLEQMWLTASRGESFSIQQRAALRLAAVHAIHQSKEVVGTAYHLAGGSAIFENQRLNGGCATFTQSRSRCNRNSPISRWPARRYSGCQRVEADLMRCPSEMALRSSCDRRCDEICAELVSGFDRIEVQEGIHVIRINKKG